MDYIHILPDDPVLLAAYSKARSVAYEIERSLSPEDRRHIKHFGYNAYAINAPNTIEPWTQFEFYANAPMRVINKIPLEKDGVKIYRWRGNKEII
jgi:hypothetical protein